MHHKDHDSDKHSKVTPIDLNEINSVDSLSRAFSKTGVFGGGQLGRAIDILEEAEMMGSTFFIGLAGAMVPAGMRKVISQAIRDGRIHALTTTGANITHDLIEVFGGRHVKKVEYQSDEELRDRGIDRVWDSFVDAGSFESFEDNIKNLLTEFMSGKEKDQQVIISPSELMEFIGERITDPDSIVRAAYDMGVPIFIPAISDSMLGLQIWLFSQFNKLVIDATKDLGRIQDVFHDSKVCCALSLGGGVPKNYTLQAALMASKQYAYAIQITMDRVETGGLSGATLEEAVSWGKIEPDAKYQTVTGDITMLLPIIYSSLRERFESRSLL